MFCATCGAQGYTRDLHRAARYKGPREDLSPPGEAAGHWIGFPPTPQIAAETCADI